MMIFVFLIAGLLFGYFLRKAGKRPSMETPMSVALLAMIFFLGVKTGEVHVNGLWLLGVSAVFAVLTIAGSLFLAGVVG